MVIRYVETSARSAAAEQNFAKFAETQMIPYLKFETHANPLSTEQVPNSRAEAWCKKHKVAIPYFETSAKNATNVEAAFTEIARRALAQDKQEENVRAVVCNTILGRAFHWQGFDQGSLSKSTVLL